MFGRIRKGKEDEQEVRVSDSVRHAQAFGLARRIQRTGKLRTRHRAWCLSNYVWMSGSGGFLGMVWSLFARNHSISKGSNHCGKKY